MGEEFEGPSGMLWSKGPPPTLTTVINLMAPPLSEAMVPSVIPALPRWLSSAQCLCDS